MPRPAGARPFRRYDADYRHPDRPHDGRRRPARHRHHPARSRPPNVRQDRHHHRTDQRVVRRRIGRSRGRRVSWAMIARARSVAMRRAGTLAAPIFKQFALADDEANDPVVKPFPRGAGGPAWSASIGAIRDAASMAAGRRTIRSRRSSGRQFKPETEPRRYDRQGRDAAVKAAPKSTGKAQSRATQISCSEEGRHLLESTVVNCRTVIASVAKQSSSSASRALDCVASLAMTNPIKRSISTALLRSPTKAGAQ